MKTLSVTMSHFLYEVISFPPLHPLFLCHNNADPTSHGKRFQKKELQPPPPTKQEDTKSYAKKQSSLVTSNVRIIEACYNKPPVQVKSAETKVSYH